MYRCCSANVCCGAKIVHADESSGPDRAATISSVSWLFSVVIPEYRGLSDSGARWIFRLRRFHALARRSGSVFREQQLLLSKIMKRTAASVCLSRICAAAQENHWVKRLQSRQKWSAGLENGAEAALRPQLAAIAQSRFRTTVDRTAAGHRIRRNPDAALDGIIHSPPDRAIRRSAAKPRINPLE